MTNTREMDLLKMKKPWEIMKKTKTHKEDEIAAEGPEEMITGPVSSEDLGSG